VRHEALIVRVEVRVAPATPGSAAYHFPATLKLDTFALAGTWTADPEALTAGPGAELELRCQADKVFLVLGGQGSVTVWVNGQPGAIVNVSAPRRSIPWSAAPGNSG
jgi:hypothetical protein